jgi:hypothetical protein
LNEKINDDWSTKGDHYLHIAPIFMKNNQFFIFYVDPEKPIIR